MTDLVLPVRKVYFDQIKSGEKTYEYRLRKPFWEKRLVGKSYDNVVITLGYPAKDDQEKRLVFPYRGYETQTIRHPHFGDAPVGVYAVICSKT